MKKNRMLKAALGLGAAMSLWLGLSAYGAQSSVIAVSYTHLAQVAVYGADRMLRVGHCIHNRPQGGGEILPAASANIVIGSNDSLAHQCNGTVVQPFYDLILCLAVRHCIHGAGGKSGDKVKPACIGVQKGIGFRDIAEMCIRDRCTR